VIVGVIVCAEVVGELVGALVTGIVGVCRSSHKQTKLSEQSAPTVDQ